MALFATTLAAAAQENADPITGTRIEPAYRPSLGTSTVYAPPPAPTAAPSTVPSAFRWGPVEAHPHLGYRFSYGDGIRARQGEESTTAIHALSPGISFALGKHWMLDYTPTLSFYSSDAFEDTVEHSVSLRGAAAYRDWTFGLQQSYAFTSSPLVETGAQTDQEMFVTALSASTRLNARTTLELGVDQSIRLPENYTEAWEWSTMDWISYQLNSKLSGAIGIGFGYVDVERGSDMMYEQLLGRIIWQVAGKVDLVVHGGVEDRQMHGSGVSDLVNPIFGATLEYRPFDVTTLSAGMNRTVSPSYFSDQVTESTEVHANLRQRLLKKFYLDLGGGYRFGNYVTTSEFAPVTREDDYTFFSARLSTTFLKRGTVGVFYYHSENSSNEGGYAYSSDQVGVDLVYRW